MSFHQRILGPGETELTIDIAEPARFCFLGVM
jgi:hypothetical protein